MISGEFPAQKPDWNNLDVLHIHTLPPRAAFVNYAFEVDALNNDVTKAKSTSLSGVWKFRIAKSPFEFADCSKLSSVDSSTWDDINVPGMWQLQGFGKSPQYTNVKYPFPVDPPNIPFDQNETGLYMRYFDIPQKLTDSQLRLRFEGVDSAFHVWLNGQLVGYSQGSRNPDEFDITPVVQERGNCLAVIVYQYCDGSYIEDQDQWWLSGIFRDVSLVGFPSQFRIENIHVQTRLDSNYTDAQLLVRASGNGRGRVTVRLFNASGAFVGESTDLLGHDKTAELCLDVKSPLKWTAETPDLYRLIVSLEDVQYIPVKVGFRQVDISGGIIKVNGERVVFRGVNRHEHHPLFGRAVPFDFMQQDLLLMKQNNINAIRTSHQPSDPRLYDLADEMGFWIIDEADLECHGFQVIADAALSPSERNLPFRERQFLTRKKAAEWTTNNSLWRNAYIDRAEHLVKRDQLHPSIVIWSLGNEAFFGQNFQAMYDHIKRYDPSRPVHYEADIDAETVDMYSRMYPPLEDLIRFAKDDTVSKPLILCEYVHAMGNGPGNIKEYVDLFYMYPKLQGGFAWEWANHGLLRRDLRTCSEYYAYGGDFGEEVHDSTFVMDGLVSSEHLPTSGLKEYKKAIEPVQLLRYNDKIGTFINRYDFRDLDHLRCFYTLVTELSKHFGSGSLVIPPAVRPGQTFDMELPRIPEVEGECLLRVHFTLKQDTPYLKAGFEVANAEMSMQATSIPRSPPSSQRPLKITQRTENSFAITVGSTYWEFDTLHGSLTSWTRGATDFISLPPEFGVYRAFTDNDLPQDGQEWTEKMVHLAKSFTRKVTWTQASVHEVQFIVKQRFAPPILSWFIETVLMYTFRSNGTLSLAVRGTPKGENLPRTLPRRGILLQLPGQLQQVTWFGRGPGESYVDSKFAQLVDRYSTSVDDLWVDYEVPQESSNRTDTRWLSVGSSGQSPSLFVQFVDKSGGRRLFDFAATHYDPKDVAAARHPFELRPKKKEQVFLRLDAAHHGLGTGSCGPKTLKQYALNVEPFEFEILFQIRSGDEL